MPRAELRLHAPFAGAVIDTTEDVIMNRDAAQQLAPTEFLGNDKVAEAKNVKKFVSRVETIRSRHYSVIKQIGSITMMPHVRQQNASPEVHPLFFRSRDSMLWFSRFDYEGIDGYSNLLMATYVHVQTPDLNGEPPLDLKILEVSEQGDNDEQPAMELKVCTATSLSQLEDTVEHLAEIAAEESYVIHDAHAQKERPQLYLVK